MNGVWCSSLTPEAGSDLPEDAGVRRLWRGCGRPYLEGASIHLSGTFHNALIHTLYNPSGYRSMRLKASLALMKTDKNQTTRDRMVYHTT